jgi:hypothetical protein
MSTLDDIAQERQRLTERLAKIDSERAKLAEELAELEAAERVFSRFTKARPQPVRRGRLAAVVEKPAAAAPRGRRGRKAAAPAAVTLSLGDATLKAVGAHGTGISAEDVRKYLSEHLAMQVRPNHLGMALQRHRRAGRLEQRDELWFPPVDGAGAAP